MTMRAGLRGRCAAVHLLAVVLLLAPLVQGDDFTDRVNALLGDIRPEQRSDLVLLPILAQTDAPPPGVSSPAQAMLVDTSEPIWSSARAWATGAKQQEFLDALHRVTQEQDYRRAMAFGQRYGQSADFELIRLGLYTELGDPPLLAAAQHLYLPILDRAASLVHVEATRLASEERIDDALDLLGDWLFFCREMADREFMAEVAWAYQAMRDALARMRDVAYLDFRYGGRKVDPDRVVALLRRIDPERGYLGTARLRFPAGERIAASQIVSMVFIPRAGVNTDTFARTMARLGSTVRPLRLFSEAAKWDAMAPVHANWFDTTAQLDRVFSDLESRWSLEFFDERMRAPWAYDQINPRRYAVLTAAVPDLPELFASRQLLVTEIAGTRTALGVAAYITARGGFPPDVSAIRPFFVKAMDVDPFNPNRSSGERPPLKYFVPYTVNYRRLGPREVKVPHRIDVIADENFAVNVDQTQFVIYSVGADGAPNGARTVQNTAELAAGTDYLIWPPMLSLERQRRAERAASP